MDSGRKTRVIVGVLLGLLFVGIVASRQRIPHRGIYRGGSDSGI